MNLLAPAEVAELQAWLDDVQWWPAGSHVWGHYAEAAADGPVVSRTENVSACHPGIAALVEGRLRDLATELLGAPAVAFKDKVNYKHPGGAGFSPHQDLPAYPGVERVVSLLVAVDECSETSGCLWLAPPAEGVLPTDDRGVLLESVTRDLVWSPAVLGAGDVAVIDGLAPHHSEANRSDRPRRVLIASYAPVAEGYDRATYYGARREVMDAVGEPRISTLGDFEGTHVLPDAVAEVHCTH
ncbi:MAG: putative oxygenase [Actinomycetia bacterium]|nr:putative oxygenase [Actinomycetes bacterium]